jgi:hypothetical protein
MDIKQAKFNPNQLTYKEGLERIRRASKEAGIKLGRGILTSRDPDVLKITNLLKVDNIPDGFQKWQLPLSLERPSQMYISAGASFTNVAEHSHNEGDGIRFIMSGSIFYKGQELTTGDWMFIPAGEPYSFEVGPFGTLMCYCYCCCCAGYELYHGDEVINPAVRPVIS